MQHRIYVVSTRADLGVRDAQEHWRERHSAVFAAVPGLLGYVQNRPLEEEWERLGRRTACSETWFTDRESERSAFAGRHYLDLVVPDEDAFLDRGSAWQARFTGDDPWQPPARYRVLAFGADELPGAPTVEVHDLDRPGPDGGAPRLLSAWVDDRRLALELARTAEALAFAAEPWVGVSPPA